MRITSTGEAQREPGDADYLASYPYLRAARALGLDYGLVLTYADALDRRGPHGDWLPGSTIWEREAVMRLTGTEEGRLVALVVRAGEYDRQASVQAAERLKLRAAT